MPLSSERDRSKELHNRRASDKVRQWKRRIYIAMIFIGGAALLVSLYLLSKY